MSEVINRIANLRSKALSLTARAQTLINGGLNDKSDTEYRAVVSELDSTQQTLAMLEETHAQLGTRSGAPTPVVTMPAIISTTTENEARQAATHREKVDAATRHWLKTGRLEARDLTTATDVSGEALVSQTYESGLNEAAKFYGPVFDLVNTRMQSDGRPRKFANVDSTSQTFTYLSDATSSRTSVTTVKQTPSVASSVNNTDTLISSIVFSVQEMEDADDLQAFFNSVAGAALGRAREYAVTVGTDNSSSFNVLPNSPAGGLLAGISAGVTQTTGTLSGGVTYAQLVALGGSVDRAYYVDGAYMASPSVEFALRAQEDSTGRPLYKTDPDTGLLLINGKLLYSNVAMAASGTASAPLVIFGNLKKAYNVISRGLLLQVVHGSNNPALNIQENMLVLSERIGASAGVASSVRSLVAASS